MFPAPSGMCQTAAATTAHRRLRASRASWLGALWQATPHRVRWRVLAALGSALPAVLWHNSVAMIGDAMLFQHSDSVAAAWDIALPILDVWRPLLVRES